jgi:hypothetical protein
VGYVSLPLLISEGVDGPQPLCCPNIIAGVGDWLARLVVVRLPPKTSYVETEFLRVSSDLHLKPSDDQSSASVSLRLMKKGQKALYSLPRSGESPLKTARVSYDMRRAIANSLLFSNVTVDMVLSLLIP